MYNQSQNYYYNQNMQTANISQYPSTSEFSGNYCQNVPNYVPVVNYTSAEYQPGKSAAKPKIKRIIYTKEQKEVLELEYNENRYISQERRAELATALNLGEKQVKVWFQNRRQKEKKNISSASRNQNLENQLRTNSNENNGNNGNNLYFHQPVNQNVNNNIINNTIPLDHQYNIYNNYSHYVAPIPKRHENQNWNYYGFDYDFNNSEIYTL